MTRVANGAIRGMLTAILVATPSLFLPSVTSDTAEVVALVALAAALLITIEYASSYPSLVEFRDAPPFNRIRFLGLFITVFLLSIVARGEADPSGFTLFVTALGAVAGLILEFPWSPVQLVVSSLPDSATPAQVILVRSAAGLAFFAAFFSFLIFYITLKIFDWPRSMGAFNVWINLPTFDPTTGGDVVARLRRDARLNIALGAVLPFVMPMVARGANAVFGTGMVDTGQTMIWMVAAWAFLPLSLFMRGVAMHRVADMIMEIRRRSTASPHDSGERAVTPAV